MTKVLIVDAAAFIRSHLKLLLESNGFEVIGEAENGKEALGKIQELRPDIVFKRLGFIISMDDFGTGYSSLSYLKRLPIDTLKIDRSFINEIESEQQQTALLQLGCTEGQGYFFSKPLNEKEFNEFFFREHSNV